MILKSFYASPAFSTDEKKALKIKALDGDMSDEAKRVSKICDYSLPDPDLKQLLWDEITDPSSTESLTELTLKMEGFWQRKQQLDLIQSYFPRYYQVLESIMETRNREFAESFMSILSPAFMARDVNASNFQILLDKCYPTIEEAEAAAAKFAGETCAERPVFAFDIDMDLVKEHITDDKLYYKDVDESMDECLVAQQRVADYDRGIAGLNKVFGIGTDLRFQQSAHVVISTAETTDTELIRQMISRGTRDLGDLHGTVFTVGDPKDERSLKQRLIDGTATTSRMEPRS